MRLSRDLSGQAGQLESDFRINVEFHVPGNILSPEFQGVRTGTFRKADRHLMVQVVVPNDPPADPYAYCLHAIGDAVDAAQPGPCVGTWNSMPSHSGLCSPC